MEKSSKEHIAAGLVKESKMDPVYQGGYTDGYDAGEQYGCIACWNDAIEAAERKVKDVLNGIAAITLIRKYIIRAISTALREIKREAPNGE